MNLFDRGKPHRAASGVGDRAMTEAREIHLIPLIIITFLLIRLSPDTIFYRGSPLCYCCR